MTFLNYVFIITVFCASWCSLIHFSWLMFCLVYNIAINKIADDCCNPIHGWDSKRQRSCQLVSFVSEKWDGFYPPCFAAVICCGDLDDVWFWFFCVCVCWREGGVYIFSCKVRMMMHIARRSITNIILNLCFSIFIHIYFLIPAFFNYPRMMKSKFYPTKLSYLSLTISNVINVRNWYSTVEILEFVLFLTELSTKI